jgi:hypothetical protein
MHAGYCVISLSRVLHPKSLQRVGYFGPCSMLPFPNFDLPPTPRETPVELQLAEGPSDHPTPRWLPIGLWYLWIALTSLGVVYVEHQSFDYQVRALIRGLLLANLLVTPAWAALAIRPFWIHFVPVFLAYSFILFIPALQREIKETALIVVIVAGMWSLLRWGRVVALDLLLPADVNGSRTPRLAERMQFSLRSLILMSAVVALGFSLYLFFHETSGWEFYKIMFFVVVPSQLLIFWGMLGRAKWYIRLPWILVAAHHWTLLGIAQRGFNSWENLYDWDHVIRWLNIPLNQIIAFGLLRWASYRLGLPKPRERALPVAEFAEPQSPWDD